MNIITTNQAKSQNDNNKKLTTINNSKNTKKYKLLDFIELIHKELNMFANPINPNGFIKDWSEWVIDKWPKNKFKTYSDFIYSEPKNTVKHQFAYALSRKFEDLIILRFNNLVQQHNVIISRPYKSYISLANEQIVDRDFDSCYWFRTLDLWDQYKDNVIVEHGSLFNACNPLVDNFTTYGLSIFPEILSKFGFIPDWKNHNCGCCEIAKLDRNYKREFKTWCSDLTLNEIQKYSLNF